jgi:hypothetical protein
LTLQLAVAVATLALAGFPGDAGIRVGADMRFNFCGRTQTRSFIINNIAGCTCVFERAADA